MNLPAAGSLVFTCSAAPQQVICPPDQVFASPELGVLLSTGGHLVEDEAQYEQLMRLLSEMGETHFHLVENQGATLVEGTAVRAPYAARFAVASTFTHFQQVVAEFDPPFGFFINHFYVFGQHPTWGLYLCEHPTLLFIGCLPTWRELFAQVYGVSGNGYAALAPFIAQEFQGQPELHAQLMRNYHLT